MNTHHFPIVVIALLLGILPMAHAQQAADLTPAERSDQRLLAEIEKADAARATQAVQPAAPVAVGPHSPERKPKAAAVSKPVKAEKKVASSPVRNRPEPAPKTEKVWPRAIPVTTVTTVTTTTDSLKRDHDEDDEDEWDEDHDPNDGHFFRNIFSFLRGKGHD